MEEENFSPNTENQTTTNLSISIEASDYLTETRKWTKFLSITGFITIGLTSLVGVFAGTLLSHFSNGQMANMPNWMPYFFGGVYLLSGLLYFFPILYLFKFSQKIKSALSTQNNDDLSIAFRYQKSFYKFLGIFVIITLSVYIIYMLIALFFLFMGMFFK